MSCLEKCFLCGSVMGVNECKMCVPREWRAGVSKTASKQKPEWEQAMLSDFFKRQDQYSDSTQTSVH